MFEQLPPPEKDKILRIMQEFAEDPRTDKIDLGVGVYRTAEATTPVMQAVRTAEVRICAAQTTKGYTGLVGDRGFARAFATLALGAAMAGSDRLAFAATPGGTGAVRQAFDLIHLARPAATVWLTDPTWPNHEAILRSQRIPHRSYRYYDTETGALDRDGMMADLAGVAPSDVVLLHACCHNPTGCDPTLADWSALGRLCAERGAVPMIDTAYLGFGGTPQEDAAGLRALLAEVPEAIVTLSGSKTFGLYRERVGLVLALCRDAAQAAVVQGTLAWLNRQNFAFPPDHGARVVTEILTDDGLRADWATELAGMRARIQQMRQALADALRAETGSDRFGFVAAHRGMFSRIGATPAQVEELRRTHGLYMIGDGRINLAGLTPVLVPRVAKALAAVLG